MAQFANIIAILESLDSCNKQSISMDECDKSTEERSMKEILESQHEDKEMGYVLQQVESEEIVNEEEVVESLGKVEQEVDSKLENTSTPSDIVDDLESSPIGLEIEIKEEDAQPPMPLVSNEEEIELEVSYQEEEVEIEEACEEMEIIKEEHKGVELARPLETSLPKSPSNTTFKWVKFLSLSFIIPLEYGLLENDGQLRALCGLRSKKESCNGWKHHSKFIMVACSKMNSNGWCRTKLHGSRRMFGCLIENSQALSPKFNYGSQREDGCKNKVWDLGIHFNNQNSWVLVIYLSLLEGLVRLIWDPGGHWRCKQWWKFKDEFKHKPP
ncbi:hypothetical protein Ahy_B08g090657 [Arachis hypogaea]|uniref:Uncharacterized protein n=1 Tax=Arachis hypogaea TaxID=3818 RepID=A0A444Y0I0_ARAHY|nr:hypothetical protein Ahy_B08g090657 [Arachis hypogaea]